MNKVTGKYLNRFTTLPVLIDLLRRKKLVLLSPERWEDRNDAEIMLEYKKRNKLKHLYAACFSIGDETIHHWNAFSSGPSGCCIEFDRQLLLDDANTIEGIRSGSVVYKKLKDLKSETIKIENIPFTKRWPYRCEEEYRIIFESRKVRPDLNGMLDIPIDLKCIRKITINQRMPDQVYQTIREYLRSEFKNPDQRINRSTLFENKIWLSKFKKSQLPNRQ